MNVPKSTKLNSGCEVFLKYSIFTKSAYWNLVYNYMNFYFMIPIRRLAMSQTQTSNYMARAIGAQTNYELSKSSYPDYRFLPQCKAVVQIHFLLIVIIMTQQTL